MKNKILSILSFCPVLSLILLLASIFNAQDLREPSQTTIGQGESANRRVSDDFALTDQNGRRFHLSQLQGKVVLLFFGYTHCPDACPTTMAKLAHVSKLLGNDASTLMTLFVSVDPDRDKPEVLKSYLAYFRLNSIGLTGSKKEIDMVVAQYGAKYEIEASDSAAGYHVNHSTDLYLLDSRGALVQTFGYSDDAKVIVDGVRKVIR